MMLAHAAASIAYIYASGWRAVCAKMSACVECIVSDFGFILPFTALVAAPQPAVSQSVRPSILKFGSRAVGQSGSQSAEQPGHYWATAPNRNRGERHLRTARHCARREAAAASRGDSACDNVSSTDGRARLGRAGASCTA
jgi:hypothetical protein